MSELGESEPLNEGGRRQDFDEDDSDLSDDVDLDFDDDSDDDLEGEGTKGRKEWQEELVNVSEPIVNEAHLHEVPWSKVAKYMLLNLITLLSFLGFSFVVHNRMVVLLPIFAMGFIMVVMAWELVSDAGSNPKFIYMFLIFMVPAIFTLVMLIVGAKTKMGIAQALFVFGPGSFFIMLVGVSAVTCLIYFRQWYRSDVYQALTGKIRVKLTRRLDLAKLAKAMTYVTVSDLRERQGWLAAKLFPCNSRIVLGMVTIDNDQKVPDVSLEIDGVEIEDLEYALVELTQVGTADSSSGEKKTDGAAKAEEDVTKDPKCPLQALEKILKRAGFIGNKHLDFWIPDRYVGMEDERPAMGDGTSEEAKKVSDWFWTHRLPPCEGGTEMNATLRRINWASGWSENWALSALIGVSVLAVLSWPSVTFIQDVVNLQTHPENGLCKEGHPLGAQLELGGAEFCGFPGLKSCNEICKNSFAFFEAVNATLHTTHVEYLLLLILLPVYIFLFSVDSATIEHERLERTYIKRLQQSKTAIREVLDSKIALEQLLNTRLLWSKFLSRFRAWSAFHSGDPDLTACGRMTSKELRGTYYENECLRKVMARLTGMISRSSVDGTALAYGVRATDEDDIAEITQQWDTLCFDNTIGGRSERNFKAVFDVEVCSEAAWKRWKDWFQKDYKTQLDYILSKDHPRAQDGGVGCHLTEMAVIGDQGIPKGFSLTHIYTTSPEDDQLFQVELNGEEITSAKGFLKELGQMERVLKSKQPTDAKAPTLAQRLEDEYPITVRFSLSEQYWKVMSPEEKLRLCGGQPTKNFAEFVGKVLTPEVKEEQTTDDGDGTTSTLNIVMGEEDPFKAMLGTGLRLMNRFGVVILSLGFAMIVPAWRWLVQGGSLFPAPFTLDLLMNMIFASIALWLFLSTFQVVSERLGVISQCLHDFERQTLDPSGIRSKQKEKKQQNSKSKKDTEEEEEASPFDLVVVEGKKVKYNPEDPWWRDQWNEKQDNIQNWLKTSSYMRVFVSTSRLTAQAILVAAAVILTFLVVMSFFQAMQGKGLVAPPSSSASPPTLRRLVESGVDMAQDARNILWEGRRLSTALAAAAARGISSLPGEQYNLHVAGADLRQRLQSFRQALHYVMEEQLEVLTSPVRRLAEQTSLGGVSITKTQVLTVAMVFLITFYSVPLLFYIAKINDISSELDSLLLAQKEVHHLNHSNRERKLEQGSSGADGESEVAGPSGEERAQLERTGTILDPGLRRYEKTLDVAIEATSANKKRFPLQLFGLTINFALMGTWVALAAAPLFQQAQDMFPKLLLSACEQVDNSNILKGGAVGDDAAFAVVMGEDMMMPRMVYTSICGPIGSTRASDEEDPVAPTEAPAAEHKPAAAHKPATNRLLSGRRLTSSGSGLPGINHEVEAWWAAHPGDGHSKDAVAQLVLAEAEAEAARLLVEAPAAVVRAHDGGGVWAAKGTAEAAYSSSRALLDGEDKTEWI